MSNPEESYDLVETYFLGLTSETGQILPKTVMLLKMIHILKLFWSFEAFRKK